MTSTFLGWPYHYKNSLSFPASQVFWSFLRAQLRWNAQHEFRLDAATSTLFIALMLEEDPKSSADRPGEVSGANMCLVVSKTPKTTTKSRFWPSKTTETSFFKIKTFASRFGMPWVVYYCKPYTSTSSFEVWCGSPGSSFLWPMHWHGAGLT